MTDENQQRSAKSPQSLKAQVEARIREAKIKSFEGELKKKIEEMQSAENVYILKKEEVEHFMEDNAGLFE